MSDEGRLAGKSQGAASASEPPAVDDALTAPDDLDLTRIWFGSGEELCTIPECRWTEPKHHRHVPKNFQTYATGFASYRETR